MEVRSTDIMIVLDVSLYYVLAAVTISSTMQSRFCNRVATLSRRTFAAKPYNLGRTMAFKDMGPPSLAMKRNLVVFLIKCASKTLFETDLFTRATPVQLDGKELSWIIHQI